MEQESKSMEIREVVKDLMWGGRKVNPLVEDSPEALQVQHDKWVIEAYNRGTKAALKAAQDAIAVEMRALLAANAELREDAERMRVMREALTLCEHKITQTIEGQYAKGQALKVAQGIARAALASTAPVAAQKEGEQNG